MHVEVSHTSLPLSMINRDMGNVYLMKYKSETFEEFKEFRQEVEKQLGKSIKIIRLDRNNEYLSLEFQGYLRDNETLS